MSLNERISKVIEYSHLTPSEFADEIDVQRSSISHITSGRNKPSLEFIIKIKSRFPEILWDWLITGDGTMLKSELPKPLPTTEEIKDKAPEKPVPTPLPDLFVMMNDEEDFGAEENKNELHQSAVQESFVADEGKPYRQITDSQRLEQQKEHFTSQAIENQNNKIKRIIIFYENGKFESFEP